MTVADAWIVFTVIVGCITVDLWLWSFGQWLGRKLYG